MPPATPRMTRGRPVSSGTCRSGWSGWSGRDLGFDRLGGEQAGVDLAQGDGERLLVDVGLHERADVLEQTLTELAVVGVDLARALRRVDDERVLRVGRREQLV